MGERCGNGMQLSICRKLSKHEKATTATRNFAAKRFLVRSTKCSFIHDVVPRLSELKLNVYLKVI